MTDFCIASPHKNVLWYDYRLYVNLRSELEGLGHTYRAASQNRIYFLGGPERKFYPEVGKFDHAVNNIALIYCHSEKLEGISHFNKVFVCSEGVKRLLTLRKYKGFEFLKKEKLFTPKQPIEIIRPFSSLTPTNNTRPRYQCDVSFIGTPRIRPIVEAAIPLVQEMGLDMKIFGPNWDTYEGNPAAKDYWIAPKLPYEEIPMLAKGSKICLIDHHDTMNKIGSVSHKYVDFVSAGALVICDNNKDAKRYYKGLCFSSIRELNALFVEYLNDDEQRRTLVEQQHEIVSEQSTQAAAMDLAKHFVK